jgi:cell division protein FtsQ
VSTDQLTRSSRPQRPRMDPRVAARRAEVSRARGRRRGWMVIVALLVVLVCVGAWFLAHSSLFSARAVTVEGSTHTPFPVVLRAAGLSTHPPLVNVDTGAAAAAVERLAWVRSATVTRHWPDGVTVAIVERVPVATVQEPGGAWALLDSTGHVLATEGDPPQGLVHLSAKGTIPAAGGTFGAAVAAAHVAATLPVAFKAQVAGIQAGSGVTLTLTSPLTVQLGSTSDLAAKYEDVAAILAGAQLHAGDTIDVSVPASPTVTGP